MTVDLSTFIQEVIDQVGRQPDSLNGTRCIWIYGQGEIVLDVGSKFADIEAKLVINPAALDPRDTYEHTYELTDDRDLNGRMGNIDTTLYTHDNLVEAVSQMIAANLNLAA